MLNHQSIKKVNNGVVTTHRERLFVDNMARLRELYGFSQREFANEIQVGRSRLQAWESKRAFPSLGYMFLISEYFGVDFMQMVTDKILSIEKLTA